MIPAQPSRVCTHCDLPLRWVNRQLGPVLVHPSGSDVCGLPGEPVTTRAQVTAVRS